MSILDFFKKRKNINNKLKEENENKTKSCNYTDATTISKDEIEYYKPDDYYTLESYPNTPMAQRVITFEERKKVTYPSIRGLYVPEILLLEYCNNGDYPKPSKGYPGFWWFTYGIRDIGSVLKSLEQRGFIEWASKLESLKNLKVDELKEIAKNYNIKTNQKKDILIESIKKIADESTLPEKYFSKKYKLTEIGKQELIENAYIPYMHKHKFKTIDNLPQEYSFNVWDLNRILENEDKNRWKEIIGNIELDRYGIDLVNEKNTIKDVQFISANKNTVEEYKRIGIKKYQILIARDSNTCEICRNVENKIFNVSEAKIGINMPPFHQGCRCTTVAYFEDEE